jgi:Mannan-binding protein.
MFTKLALSLWFTLIAISGLFGRPLMASETIIDIEAGPIWSNEHADTRCPEVAEEWTASNPGREARWTGDWKTTVPGEMSVCNCDISETEEPIEIPDDDDVPGRDLRTRRGYSHAGINEEENFGLLYFYFDDGKLAFFRNEPSMGLVFSVDLSGLPNPREAADAVLFEDVNGDGFADLKIPAADGKYAVWRWASHDWTFVATETSTLLPAPAATRKTLAALPAWTSPHAIVHFGKAEDIAERIADSWLLDCSLDIHADRKLILELLQRFPAESFSFVTGLIDDDDVFQGALRFPADSQDALAAIEALLPPDKDASEEENAAIGKGIFENFSQLTNNMFTRRYDRNMGLSVGFVDDRQNLFEIYIVLEVFDDTHVTPKIYASVAEYDGERMLVIGSEPEEVERAINALEDESARLAATPRDMVKPNFIKLVDDKEGSLADEIAGNVNASRRAPAAVEFSFDLSAHAVDVSVFHNIPEILFGNIALPVGGWRADDAGFGFGGRTAWLAGAFSPVATDRNITDFLRAVAGDDAGKARGMLQSSGVDGIGLIKSIRSLGIVCGGWASMRERTVPGGYVFASGDADKLGKFAPLFKAVIGDSLEDSFEEKAKDGWDFFFSPNDEFAESMFDIPLFIGMKDGVLLGGILDEDSLENVPAIDWESTGSDGGLLRACMNLPDLASEWEKFFKETPRRFVYHSIAGRLGVHGFFEANFLANAFKIFAAAQEVKTAQLDIPDWNHATLRLELGEVDYRKVWEWMRMSRAMEADDY